MKYNKVPSITESLKKVASSEARNMSALPAMRFVSGVVPSRRNTVNGNRKPNRDADKKSVGEIDWNNFAASRGSYKNFDLISKKESYNVIVEPVEPSTLLLDLYPNAAAAYSLRKLRSDYTGPAIRVRETASGLHDEQDIYFVGNELDTASLLSFVGAGDGFVTTWYDQSGSGFNATQITASKQPFIVSNGVLIEENGKPCVSFLAPLLNDMSLSQYPFTSGGDATEKSIFAVATNDSVANQNLYNIADSRDIYALTYNRSANNTYSFLGANYGSIGGNVTGQNIISSFAISPSSETFSNGIEGIDSNLVRANFNELTIGSRGGSYPMNGTIQEIFMYESNQTANRLSIESNINSHYNIYWDGSQTSLLDDYPSAAAAYSLRALNSGYLGAAIKVRRSSDNAEQNIKFLYDGSLDTASLLSFVGANDGFVSVWYDQSGSGNNSTQSTAASQPKIVSSGVIELENGKPAITTSGAKNLNTGIVNLGVSGDIPLSFYSVQNNQSTSDKDCLIGLTDNTLVTDRRRVFMYLKDDSTKISLRLFGGSCVYNLSPPTNQVLFSSNYASGGGAIDSRVNSTDLTVSSFSNSGLNVQANSGFILFSGNAATAPQLTTTDSASQGSLQECIFYLNDKSASTSAIETNINSYYSIY